MDSLGKRGCISNQSSGEQLALLEDMNDLGETQDIGIQRVLTTVGVAIGTNESYRKD